MIQNPTMWQAHVSPYYDQVMGERCEVVLGKIRNDAAYRVQIRTDPRELHQFLFENLTPPQHPEYAGTFRGTPNTSLAGRIAVVNSVLPGGGTYSFAAPDEVVGRIERLGKTVSAHIVQSKTDEHRKTALAFQFAWLGRIHPFLDGNGHVQRVLFAALAIEFGYSLNKRFVIHPRPFGRLFATALELFTREPEATSTEQLELVTEYLRFFID